MKSRRGQKVQYTCELPCYKGRGGARPGAGRPKLGQTKKTKRRAGELQAHRPRTAHRKPRLRPRGPLTDAEAQKWEDDRVYKELMASRQLITSQADAVITLQVELNQYRASLPQFRDRRTPKHSQVLVIVNNRMFRWPLACALSG